MICDHMAQKDDYACVYEEYDEEEGRLGNYGRWSMRPHEHTPGHTRSHLPYPTYGEGAQAGSPFSLSRQGPSAGVGGGVRRPGRRIQSAAAESLQSAADAPEPPPRLPLFFDPYVQALPMYSVNSRGRRIPHPELNDVNQNYTFKPPGYDIPQFYKVAPALGRPKDSTSTSDCLSYEQRNPTEETKLAWQGMLNEFMEKTNAVPELAKEYMQYFRDVDRALNAFFIDMANQKAAMLAGMHDAEDELVNAPDGVQWEQNVVKFVEATGATRSVAEYFLVTHSNDIDLAINIYIDTAGAHEGVDTGAGAAVGAAVGNVVGESWDAERRYDPEPVADVASAALGLSAGPCCPKRQGVVNLMAITGLDEFHAGQYMRKFHTVEASEQAFLATQPSPPLPLGDLVEKDDKPQVHTQESIDRFMNLTGVVDVRDAVAFLNLYNDPQTAATRWGLAEDSGEDSEEDESIDGNVSGPLAAIPAVDDPTVVAQFMEITHADPVVATQYVTQHRQQLLAALNAFWQDSVETNADDSDQEMEPVG